MKFETEEENDLYEIIIDYENNNNLIIDNKLEILKHLHKFNQDVNWEKLGNYYEKYDARDWEDLMIKMIKEKIS